jgi:hypothetical protein
MIGRRMDKKTCKLAKKLREDGKNESCNHLIASSASKNAINPRPDLSYSYIMRRLRQIGDKNRTRSFQEAFKKAYDEAYINDLENIDDVALLQALQESDIKAEEVDESAESVVTESEIEYDLTKLGQAATDLGDPSFSGKAISEIIKFLLRKIPYEQRPHRMMGMRQKILELNEYDMANKKSPDTASMGQSLTLIKTLLNGKDPQYIRRTLEHIVGNLV